VALFASNEGGLMALSLALSLLLLASQVVAAQAPAPVATLAPLPPAPAPGSPGTYKSGAELASVLKAAIARGQDVPAAAIASNDQYRVNIVHRTRPGAALAHAGNSELHYIIEGTGTLVTGGRIVTPAGGNAASATIDGGETRRVSPAT